eukprot:Nk52_evm16s358 gene=Nk52_evmTU16s358
MTTDSTSPPCPVPPIHSTSNNSNSSPVSVQLVVLASSSSSSSSLISSTGAGSTREISSSPNEEEEEQEVCGGGENTRMMPTPQSTIDSQTNRTNTDNHNNMTMAAAPPLESTTAALGGEEKLASSMSAEEAMKDPRLWARYLSEALHDGKGALEFKFEDIVWARCGGFCHWPGQIKDPMSAGIQEHILKLGKPGMMLVLFFGSYDCAWVTPGKNNPLPFMEHHKACEKKSKGKLFRAAVEEADRFVKEGVLPPNFNMLAEEPEPGTEEGGEPEEEQPEEEEVNYNDSEVIARLLERKKKRLKLTPAEKEAIEKFKEKKAMKDRKDKVLRRLALKKPLPVVLRK